MKNKLILILATTLILFSGISAAKKEGPSKVSIKVLKNNNYQLLVNNKPYVIKGFCYNPIPISQGYDYDFWNDTRAPWKIDGKLMKDMGVNTVRFYQSGEDIESVKKVISELYKSYGIRTIMGNWLGFWNYPAPFYADETFRKGVKEEVLKMVNDYKNEPGILFWVLGNENNYSFSGKVNSWSCAEIDSLEDANTRMNEKARIYYSFIDELTKEIHAIDPNHPVAMGNGELATLDVAKKHAPNIDIIACIIYRGKSFGNIFKSLRNIFDKPLVFIEFGCDAYNAYTNKEDQVSQAEFLESQWHQIFQNVANKGEGNCLGGATFEWSDEWWKHKECYVEAWSNHDTESNWSNGAYYFDIKAEGNKNMNEEGFGVVSLSKSAKEGELDIRTPRKSYYVLKDLWRNPNKKINEKPKIKKK